MSIPNFHTQKGFKLFVQHFEFCTMEEYQKEYFDSEHYLYDEYENAEDEAEKIEILEKAYDEDAEFYQNIFYENLFEGADGFEPVMENFNDSLTFLRISMKSGYYDGAQLYVDVKTENPIDLDNDDCRYYFDECRSKCIRKFRSEINKVNKWMEKIATQYGWKELICLGIFSNGEAIYQYAENCRDAVKATVEV